MRTKDEILQDARKDISDKQFKDEAHLWVELRKLEVLIDIRDIFSDTKIVLSGIYHHLVLDK